MVQGWALTQDRPQGRPFFQQYPIFDSGIIDSFNIQDFDGEAVTRNETPPKHSPLFFSLFYFL